MLKLNINFQIISIEMGFAAVGYRDRIKKRIEEAPEVVNFIRKDNTLLEYAILKYPEEIDLIKFMIDSVEIENCIFNFAIENNVKQEIIDMIDYKISCQILEKITNFLKLN